MRTNGRDNNQSLEVGSQSGEYKPNVQNNNMKQDEKLGDSSKKTYKQMSESK